MGTILMRGNVLYEKCKEKLRSAPVYLRWSKLWERYCCTLTKTRKRIWRGTKKKTCLVSSVLGWNCLRSYWIFDFFFLLLGYMSDFFKAEVYCLWSTISLWHYWKGQRSSVGTELTTQWWDIGKKYAGVWPGLYSHWSYRRARCFSVMVLISALQTDSLTGTEN